MTSISVENIWNEAYNVPYSVPKSMSHKSYNISDGMFAISANIAVEIAFQRSFEWRGSYQSLDEVR